jgi:hypothetical protein
MKLQQAAAELAKLAEANDAMSFIFDTAQEGRVRIDWQGCMKIEVAPANIATVVDAMRMLEDLGITVI